MVALKMARSSLKRRFIRRSEIFIHLGDSMKTISLFLLTSLVVTSSAFAGTVRLLSVEETALMQSILAASGSDAKISNCALTTYAPSQGAETTVDCEYKHEYKTTTMRGIAMFGEVVLKKGEITSAVVGDLIWADDLD